MKLILGPTPCANCRAPVTVVRRDVELPCTECENRADGDRCRLPLSRRHLDHTHTLRDVGPFTAVDADGLRHVCQG